MASRERLEKKLRRYRILLADYHRLIKETDQDMKDGLIPKEKGRKRKNKFVAKKDRVLSKMKAARMKLQESE